MITLLTDFGTADYFVPAVKGAILSIHPQAQIIDLTHQIPPQNIAAAAFTLSACYQNFPAGTIHVAVVDPGVGSARRAIVVEAADYCFVGPDNGLFSPIYAREKTLRVYHAARPEYFRHPVSTTFHGRDIFAPLAAWLEKGVSPAALGTAIDDYIQLAWPQPQQIGEVIRGQLIHIDHFGNCITNLTANELSLTEITDDTRLLIGAHEVRNFGTHFAQSPDELMAYPGSAGYWEIALWQASAAQMLNVQVTAVVDLYC